MKDAEQGMRRISSEIEDAGARRLTVEDVRDLAWGTAFLGSGGGGDPYLTRLMVEAELNQGKVIRLIDLSALANDDLVAPCGWLGAPTVSAEKLPNGEEALRGLAMLEEIKGRRVRAIFPIEIGGGNGLSPLVLAARAGIPVMDCDGMGRAFPESQMVMFNVYGQSASPVVVTDEKGNCVVLHTASNGEEERLVRALAISMGGQCHVIDYPSDGYQVKQHAVRGTISLAMGIGRAVREARRAGLDPFAGLFSALGASGYYGAAGVLFDGKIVDLERETKQGFAIGRVILEAFGSKSRMEVEFQNENLIARDADGAVRATVPDILSILDRETAETITTERLRYGQRVKLVGASVPPILRRPEALRLFGPEAFGLPGPYRPIEDLNQWRERP